MIPPSVRRRTMPEVRRRTGQLAAIAVAALIGLAAAAPAAATPADAPAVLPSSQTPAGETAVPLMPGQTASVVVTGGQQVTFTAPGVSTSQPPIVRLSSPDLQSATGGVLAVPMDVVQDGTVLTTMYLWAGSSSLRDIQWNTLDPLRPWSLVARTPEGISGTLSVELFQPKATTQAIQVGVPVTVTFGDTPGEYTRLTFPVTKGERVIVKRTDTRGVVKLRLEEENGARVESWLDPSSSSDVASDPITKTGAYALVVFPLGESDEPVVPRPATITVTVLTVANITVGSGKTTTVSWKQYQSVSAEVVAKAGARATLQVFASPARPSDEISVYLRGIDVDYYQVVGWIGFGAPGFVESRELEAGRYRLELGLGGEGTMTLRADVVSDVRGRLAVGRPAVVDIAKPGVNAALTFALPRPRKLTWSIAKGPVTSGRVVLKNAQGDTWGYALFDGDTRSGLFQLEDPIPAGTYTLTVDPDGAATGKLHLLVR